MWKHSQCSVEAQSSGSSVNNVKPQCGSTVNAVLNQERHAGIDGDKNRCREGKGKRGGESERESEIENKETNKQRSEI